MSITGDPRSEPAFHLPVRPDGAPPPPSPGHLTTATFEAWVPDEVFDPPPPVIPPPAARRSARAAAAKAAAAEDAAPGPTETHLPWTPSPPAAAPAWPPLPPRSRLRAQPAPPHPNGARSGPVAATRGGTRPRAPGRAARLLVARHRRWVVAGLTAASAAAAVTTLSPAPGRSDPVPVAIRDLPAGHTLGAGDVRTARWPVGIAPAGLVTTPTGRRLAAPVRSGEAITDVRLAGPGLLNGQPRGTVAVGIRPADVSTTAMVHPGDRVDVYAGPGQDGSPPAAVVSGALVLATVDTTGDGAPLPGIGTLTASDAEAGGAGLLVLAVPGSGLARVAALSAGRPLTIAVLPTGDVP